MSLILVRLLALATLATAPTVPSAGARGDSIAATWDGAIRGRTAAIDEVLLGRVPLADSGYAAVRAALAARAPAALLAYTRDGNSLGALVLRTDTDAPAAVSLGSLDVLTSRVRLLAREGGADARARVREMIWDPLASRLEAAGTIFVVADPLFRRVPLQALLEPRDRSTVRLLVTERELLEPAPAPRDAIPRLVAVGDLLYDSLGAGGSAFGAEVCPAARSPVFRTRPAAAAEMDALRVAWGAYVPEGEQRLLTGTIATETRVRDALPGIHFLHVSSRGYVLDDLCPEATFPAGTVAGVALTGANAATGAKSAAEDGLLSTGEIARLPLTGVESVVVTDLPATAEVGSGGAGWLTLARAFHLAGARAVILRVPEAADADAEAWLEAYYRGLLADRKPAVQAAAEATAARAEALGPGAGWIRWMPFLVFGR